MFTTNPIASVCICTYNGETRMSAVLEALIRQDCPREQWEIVIVNNASSDNTGAVVEAIFKHHSEVAGRVVDEPRAGLSFARQRAAAEAKGELILFLDDDNIADPLFVRNAIQAFAERPKAGALGGRVIASWETTPTPLALAVQDFALAICDRGDRAFCYERGGGPVGAGFCIRAVLLRAIYARDGEAASVIGRDKSGYGAGEDLALAVRVWEMGCECWYVPGLILEHQLPRRRMEPDYLQKLYFSIGQGQAAVRRIFDWKARTPLAWIIAAKDAFRLLTATPRHTGAQDSLASELADLQSRLIRGRIQKTLKFWN